jgi:hypothetical protein
MFTVFVVAWLMFGCRRSLACRNYFAYTQGPARWNPINGGFGINGKPACPDNGDCSSYATWIYWTVIGQNGGMALLICYVFLRISESVCLRACLPSGYCCALILDSWSCSHVLCRSRHLERRQLGLGIHGNASSARPQRSMPRSNGRSDHLRSSWIDGRSRGRLCWRRLHNWPRPGWPRPQPVAKWSGAGAELPQLLGLKRRSVFLRLTGGFPLQACHFM